MSTRRTKFDWHRSVLSDERFTMAQRAVLAYLLHVVTGPDLRTTFTLAQKRLVPLLHTSEPTVNGAFARERELGYLMVVAEHKRGTKRGDTFHLSMPADAVKATQIPLVTSDELTQIPLVTGPKNL